MLIVKPKAVIFDWDNTLVDSWGLMHATLNHTMEQAGLSPWSMEEIKSKMHGSMRDHFPSIFGEQYEKMRNVYYTHYIENHLQHLSPLDGVTSVLRLLQEQGIFAALVSNKHGEVLRKEVSFLHWDNYFNVIIGAEDTAEDKPSPVPAYQAIASCNLPKHKSDEVWFVGDTVVDMQCAVNAKCQPVLFGDSANMDDVRNITAAKFHHVRNHYEFLELLCLPSVRITA